MAPLLMQPPSNLKEMELKKLPSRRRKRKRRRFLECCEQLFSIKFSFIHRHKNSEIFIRNLFEMYVKLKV